MNGELLALRYAGRLGPVFARPGGHFIGKGWKDASAEPDRIIEMWREHPNALIATPTGQTIIVLDIDRKNGKDGFDTLDRWGKSMLPETPMAHTPNGGLHVYFAVNPAASIGWCINWPYGPGEHTKQSGLDVLGHGTSVALPTPGYRYRWDDHLNFKTVPLMVAPAWLAIKRHSRSKQDWEREKTLAAETLLREACARIRNAGPGSRHALTLREGFIIGCVVARGRLDEASALHELRAAGGAMVWDKSYTARQGARDLDDAFKAGLRKGGVSRSGGLRR